MIKDLDKKIKAYALKNALAHGGKANPGSVVSALFNEGLEKKDVKKVMPEIQKEIRKINKLSEEEQRNQFNDYIYLVSERKVREGLPELPHARKGNVIMRFAPSASGALHIGHAMTACLSYLYVQEHGGKFYIRIEDTNPENSFKESYKLIEKDIDFLFKKKPDIVIQSDRMQIYYDYVQKLIKKKSAYVCTCEADIFREFVKTKKPCPCRNLDVKENLDRWNKMFSEYKEGDAVLRFKSDMTHKNPAMRDFPLARINDNSHPRQKNKYRVWPLMNLAVAVDDMEMKMTHIIRAKDHRDNAQRQKMIYDVFKKKFPWTGFLGRWHFKGFELSTSKIRVGVKEGKYSGWDDPELPTIAALKKKKYKPEAFLKFVEKVGFSESDKVIDKDEYFKLLDTFNKGK